MEPVPRAPYTSLARRRQRRRASPSRRRSLRDDGRALYSLRYHVLLVTRRRRPFFRDPEVRALCERLLREACAEVGCGLEALVVGADTVRARVTAPPELSPHLVVQKMRDVARPLREAYPEMERNGGVFSRRYMVSTRPMAEPRCGEFLAGVPRR